MGKKDHKIGFAHVINIQDSCENTKYGQFMAGSPLSYQLAIFDTDFEIILTISEDNTCKTK